jgi:hypothetical protein
VVQGVDPEFKPQYCKKKKINNIDNPFSKTDQKKERRYILLISGIQEQIPSKMKMKILQKFLYT